MGRPIRIQYEGAWYHVMNRTAGKKNLFRESSVKKLFLSLLEEACLRFDIEIHAFCIMDNHYHLLVKTPQANLADAMKHISGVFTKKYNYFNCTDGPFFRGRYKGILVDNNSYLFHVCRYIHLNPTEANIVDKVVDYKWSSYPSYLGGAKFKWLQTEEILSMHNSLKNFQAFSEAGIDNETREFYSKRIPESTFRLK